MRNISHASSTKIKTPSFGWVKEGRLYIQGRLLPVDWRLGNADVMPQTGIRGFTTAFLLYHDLAGVVLSPDNLSALSILETKAPRNKLKPL
jgi:hypothetical protein